MAADDEGIIVGISITMVSLVLFYLNVLLFQAIWADKESLKLNAYKFILMLVMADLSQLPMHALGGVYAIFDNEMHPAFNKITGAVNIGGYVLYTAITVVLALNRLTQVISPHTADVVFSNRGMFFWYGVCLTFGFGYFVVLSSPLATCRFLPHDWTWDYDQEYPYSKLVQTVEMYLEIGGYTVACGIYVLIFLIIIRKKSGFNASANRKPELIILAQTTSTTGYMVMLNIFWHNYTLLLPDNRYAYLMCNYIWVFGCGMNAIVYYIVHRLQPAKKPFNRTAVSGVTRGRSARAQLSSISIGPVSKVAPIEFVSNGRIL